MACKTWAAYESGQSGDNNLQNNQDLQIVDGIEGLRQCLLMKLRLWKGEWPLAKNNGVPYVQEIFARYSNADLASTIITSIIRSEPEVTGVHDIRVTSDPATRKVNYSCVVETIFGETDLQLSA